jgi:hypothetical protein
MRHIPEGHPPASAGSERSPDGAANTESILRTCSVPQEGHFTSWPSEDRTNFSNLVPQSEQAYSKIGITVSLPFYFIDALYKSGCLPATTKS